MIFSFLPADIVSQILNFGLPAPIDVQVTGYDLQSNRQFANKLLRRIEMVSGTADLRIQQPFDEPHLRIDVDRTKTQLAGFTQRDVAQNLLISLSGSFQTSPTYWLNPKNGVSYSIATQTPQYRVDSLQDLENIPITGPSGASPAILGSLASIRRGTGMALVSHYDIQPVIDIYGSVQRRDLGGVADDIKKIVDDSRKELPRGSEMVIRGQVQTMKSSYSGLISGLAFAILLVYLLIVVNFQSWLDPFIIISALPAALAGIVWFLFITKTQHQRARPDRIYHVYGRGHGQQHPGGELCQRTDGRRQGCGDRRDGLGVHPLPSGPDDGAGDDYRYDAHGRRPRRRRRAECAAGPRGDWRVNFCHGCDPVLCSRVLQPPA